MLIDKNGRLFGKISIVDIVVALLIIVAVSFVGLRFVKKTSMASQQAEKVYVVEVKDIKESSIKYFKVGDTLYNEDGAYLGIIDIEPEITVAMVSQEKSDGSFAYAEKPGRYDVRITIRGKGFDNGNAFFLDGKVALLVGAERYFKADDIDFTGNIIEIID